MGRSKGIGQDYSHIAPVRLALYTAAMVTLASRDYRQWLRAQWRDGLGWAVALFVALRVTFSLYGLAEATFVPVYAPCTAASPAPTLYADGLALPSLGVWQRADGCMYEMIAGSGYPPGALARFAFFPLYPLLLRLVSPLLAGNLTLTGMVLSGLAYIAAATGLYRLASRDFDPAVARRAVLYMSAFPSAFFLFAGFTEALFVALSVWALYAARRRWWAWAGLLGLLAALTRTQGVFLALPLAWEVWRSLRLRGEAARLEWRTLAVPLGPILGFLLFNAFIWRTLGLTSMEVQRHWGMRTAAPWTVLASSWRYIQERASPPEAANLFLLLLCTLLVGIGMRRIPFSYTLVCAPQLLVLLTRETYHSPLISVSRLLIVLFPCFVVLALLGQRPWLHRTWLTISVSLLLVLLTIFLGGAFVA
jgi:hypothetical protein